MRCGNIIHIYEWAGGIATLLLLRAMYYHIAVEICIYLYINLLIHYTFFGSNYYYCKMLGVCFAMLLTHAAGAFSTMCVVLYIKPKTQNFVAQQQQQKNRNPKDIH